MPISEKCLTVDRNKQPSELDKIAGSRKLSPLCLISVAIFFPVAIICNLWQILACVYSLSLQQSLSTAFLAQTLFHINKNFISWGLQSLLKEAPYSWFSLKHFSYRSESSQDSHVESLIKSLFFSFYRSKHCWLFFLSVMWVWNFNIVLLNRFQTVFSGFYIFPFNFMFCKIRSKLFDLYYSVADYNKHILCMCLRQSKVSLKLIYYVLLLNTMHM